MFNGLLLLTGALFLAEWAAVAGDRKKMRRFTKPAALVALLAWFTQQSLWQGWLWWFGLGLVFSLAGDILLLLPGWLFPAGALAFLLAHAAYVTGLNQNLAVICWQGGLILVCVVTAAFVFGRKLLANLQQAHHSRRLRLLIIAYMTAISLMLYSALLTPLRPGWPPTAAALTIAGAIFFFTSDSILAWNKFVRPIRSGHLLVMMTYHLGQLGIVSGALLAFGEI
jgi:uncharacterized membrane protein YhhN